jgi:hypothetical protein
MLRTSAPDMFLNISLRTRFTVRNSGLRVEGLHHPISANSCSEEAGFAIMKV